MKKIFLLLVLLFPALSFGQGLNADGRDYYIGWLYPTYNAQNVGAAGAFFNGYVLISSYTDNKVSISYFDERTGKEVNKQNYSVARHRAIQVPIDQSRMKMTDPGEIPEFKSMHITTKAPINVQFFSTGANSGGSYLAIPTNVLGKEYVIESYHDNSSGEGGVSSHESSSGYFMIIASSDNTDIQIIPNSTTKGKKQPGVNCGSGSMGIPQPFTQSLQRGQCYMVKSQGDSSCDISGSTVISNKPIAVIAGHENAFIDGSSVGSINVDQRDFMIEQMLPVEYWDSVGYISVPFVDSKSAPGGDGDNLAFFYGKLQNDPINYPNKSTVTLLPSLLTFDIEAFPSTTALKTGIMYASSSYSSNGVKFYVVQYDQRMLGSLAPFPAPSQMSLIPQSRWKTSYLWYVPDNTPLQKQYQGYYITLICDKTDFNNATLKWSVNGGPLIPIKSAGAVGGIKSIPGNPELIGMAVKLSAPRSYYATSTIGKPFMIYNYGFLAFDDDNDLGDFDEDDHFFSYAAPSGFAVSPDGLSSFHTHIDTLCAKWDLCVKVSGVTMPKIRSFSLLNDTSEDFVDKPNSSIGYQSYNTRFDLADDPNDEGEVDFYGIDSFKCIRLFVANPLKPAYAALLVQDDHGNTKVVEFTYKAPAFADTTKSNDFDLTKSPWQILGATARYHSDTILYPITGIGDSHCATTYYYNTGDSLQGTPPTTVTGVKLGGVDGSFTMNSVPSAFPLTLRPKSPSHPADTLKVTVCFTSKDTALHLDTLTLSTDCFEAPVELFGPGGTAMITATDYDFGNVLIGSTTCTGSVQNRSKITVQNIGNLPFTLTKLWIITNIIGGKEFTISPISEARLPYTLFPAGDPSRRDTINLDFCYSPIDVGFDSSIVPWGTDIKQPYTNLIKPWSYLKGNGIKSSVVWDRSKETIFADSNIKPTQVEARVHLYSNANQVMHVDKVYFTGPEAAEFILIDNQLSQNPLEGFDMNIGDSIWVDIAFVPDYTKPNFNDRHADLFVTFFIDDTRTKTDTNIINVIGTFRGALSVESAVSNENNLKAYISNRQLIIELPNNTTTPTDCSLYDILGRKVKSWTKEETLTNSSGLVLPMPPVSSGAYILRVTSENNERSCVILIQ